MKKIIWHRYEKRFALDLANGQSEQFVIRPLHSKQINEAIRFLKKNYPELKDSFYGQYLKRKFYEQEVALLDQWSRHQKSRHCYFLVVIHEASGKICALGSALSEQKLPLLVTQIGACDPKYQKTKLFEVLLRAGEEGAQKSGIEHILCVATACTPAAQRAYLNLGFSVAGIVPGGDVYWEKQQYYFIPDVYFYKFMGKAKAKSLPESQWQLVPEVAAVWKAIKQAQKS